MTLLLRLCAGITALVIGQCAGAQGAPQGPVKIVVGFAAGGPPDITARLIAARLEKRWQQPVTVENVVGASGTIAAANVARSKPDGQTLLFGVAANLAVAPATMRTPPYDPTTAFSPIAEVARGPYLWLVRADAPATDMPGFIRWARQNPGKLAYGSPGQGTVHHLATEMLKQSQGIYLLHVPYRVAPYTALVAGDVQGMFESMPAPLPLIESGRLRALAVTGPKRLAVLPNVPTFAEQGLPGIDVHSWWGFVGPAGMAPALVAQVNDDIRNVLADPDVRAALARAGIEPGVGTPDAFGRFIAQEAARWKHVVAERALALE